MRPAPSASLRRDRWRAVRRLLAGFLLLPYLGLAAPADLRAPAGAPGSFPLVVAGRALPLVLTGDSLATDAGAPIRRAAGDLAQDVAAVTGRVAPALLDVPAGGGAVADLAAPACLVIGRIGDGGLIDRLVAEGKLAEARALGGTWESFAVMVVEFTTPPPELPGVTRALFVVGSDVRGTIYGLYEISEAIGVSPWHWWADVPVVRDADVALRAGPHVKGPPAVKYRGVFLNDEDWGLQPWAARTHEPEHGDIGPRTYARLFELLLRLRANTFWPAMHACTRPFNTVPGLGELAQDYGLIRGTSHAEPMLCNNVGEWAPRPPEDFNYTTHRNSILNYWEDRLVTHGRFENIYTLGMRGIHDSGMQGGGTRAEQIARLERIFADQRFLLEDRIHPDVTRVPQIFCAYKEVLDLYRGGLRVPEDVTLVWPDDNFGYIRTFPSAAEAERPGGNGIYYHVSYLGRPLAYLWLSTTPPALIWQQMTQAFDHGARELWIVNVGDLKPAEIATEFFLQLAWEHTRWSAPDAQPRFLTAWAEREFGAAHAVVVAEVMAEFYQLNFRRRPEHLQWWLPRTDPRPSDLTPVEVETRLAAFARLTATVDALAAALPPAAQAAFYQLVVYPVRGAALANERFFALEAHARLAVGDPAGAQVAGTRAHAAHAALERETRYFNEELSGGKWRHFMMLEPADDQWRGMRLAAPTLPPMPVEDATPPSPTRPGTPAGTQVEAALAAGRGVSARWEAPAPPAVGIERAGVIVLEAEHFHASGSGAEGVTWDMVPGLGRTGTGAVTRGRAGGRDPIDATRAPWLEYRLALETPGEWTLTLWVLPTHPSQPDAGLRVGVAVGAEPARVVTLPHADGNPEWSQAVLANTRLLTTRVTFPAAGSHTLRLVAVDAGVVVDKLVLSREALPPSYLGPLVPDAESTTPAP